MALPDSPDPVMDAVLAANATFYDAFERADIDAMSDIWEHSDRVSCVHPGWAILQGWAAVSASWFALFNGPQRLQFIVTDVTVSVGAEVAWVTCNENLLDRGAAQAVAATNVFVRHDDGAWRLVLHQGSPVLQRETEHNT